MDTSWACRAVLEVIVNAFGDLSPPTVDETPEPGCNIEQDEIRVFFRGRHWKDIPLSEIPWEGSFLYHLTPIAFRFYLPAYMRAVIEDYERLDTLPHDLVSILNSGSDLGLPWVRAFRLFTPGQKRAVRRFLEYIRDVHSDDTILSFEADMALERYWYELAPPGPAGRK